MYNFNLISNMENNSNNNNTNNNNSSNNNTSNNLMNKTTNNNYFGIKNNNTIGTMEWSNEICLRLIDEYKNFPALWDQTSPYYKNKLKRKESWCRLAERFGCSKAEVERKMNVLLTQYRREKHKMLMQVYKGELKCSRWYAFKKFSFMENGLRPKKQQRALQLLNAMQLRLGFNPLQSVNTPPLQNLAAPWHSSSSDLHNQPDNNSSISINNNENDPSCGPPSVQDLSISHISGGVGVIGGVGQHQTNSIQQSANSTIEDEMVEINVDPLNLLRGHHNSSPKSNSINPNNSNNSNNNPRQQRSESLGFHRDVKEEIFDSSSIDNDDHHNNSDQIIDQSYQHNDQVSHGNQDDDDDDRYSILDYRRNRFNSCDTPNTTKKKLNFHPSEQALFHHHLQSLQNASSSEQNQQQNGKDEKLSDRWSGLLPPPTTSSSEKPSTTKLFQNYESQSMSIADKDDCDFIGLNVSLKLRSMEESQRIIAEKLISDVLFYGQFKELDKSANVCPKRDIINAG